MAVGGVETEAVVVIVALHSHLLAELYSVQVTSVTEFAAPFHYDLYSLDFPQIIWLLAWIPFQSFHLELGIQFIEISSRLKYDLHLKVILKRRIFLLQLSNDTYRNR